MWKCASMYKRVFDDISFEAHTVLFPNKQCIYVSNDESKSCKQSYNSCKCPTNLAITHALSSSEALYIYVSNYDSKSCEQSYNSCKCPTNLAITHALSFPTNIVFTYRIMTLNHVNNRITYANVQQNWQ